MSLRDKARLRDTTDVPADAGATRLRQLNLRPVGWLPGPVDLAVDEGAADPTTAEPFAASWQQRTAMGGWVPTEGDESSGPRDTRISASGTRPLPGMMLARVRSFVHAKAVSARRRLRWELRLPAVVALVVVAVTAAAVAVVEFHLAQPQPIAATAPATPPVPAAARPAPPSPSASLLIVDVTGPVRFPGVVRLAAGSRAVDAIRAAGGLLPGAQLGAVNLAAVVSDGEQIVVGSAAPDSSTGLAPGNPNGQGAPVDLNAATVAQLDTLPGVGPVLAQRIVDFRTSHGPFTSVDQLRQVGGIGDRKFDELRQRVRV